MKKLRSALIFAVPAALIIMLLVFFSAPVSNYYVPHRDDPDYNSSADNTMAFDTRNYIANCGPGGYGLVYGFQVLAGNDIYYTLGSFESRPISWPVADIISICRKSADNPQEDKIICEAFEEPVINGMMDTGEDLLLWSCWRENSNFRVWQMSYNGRKTSLILDQPLEIQVMDAVMVKDRLWYAGYTFDYPTRTARSEIYELNLNRHESVCIYSSDTVIPELMYADGELFFLESEQALKSLNPDNGEVRTLAVNENFSGFVEESGSALNNAIISIYEVRKRMIALNSCIYFRCDWNGKIMSVGMDGSDLKPIMEQGNIYFRQILRNGVAFEASYETDPYNQYLCLFNDPGNPAFDPENSVLMPMEYENYILSAE